MATAFNRQTSADQQTTILCKLNQIVVKVASPMSAPFLKQNADRPWLREVSVAIASALKFMENQAVALMHIAQAAINFEML